MVRLRVRRDPLRDLRDKEIERLQQHIDALEIELQTTRTFVLNVNLLCTSGNASFTGTVDIADIHGTSLSVLPLDGFFRSSRRREARRDFAIPMFVKYDQTNTTISLDKAVSPDWQGHAETEIKRKNLEHLLRARTRARR